MRASPAQILCQNQGQTLIESLIVIVLVSVLLLFSAGAFSNIFSSQAKSSREQVALQFAIEGLEFAYNYNINKTGWLEGVCGETDDPGLCEYADDCTTLDPDDEACANHEERIGLKRVLRKDYARRDANGNLVDDLSSGDIDENMIKTVSTITWTQGNQDKELKLVTYLLKP